MIKLFEAHQKINVHQSSAIACEFKETLNCLQELEANLDCPDPQAKLDREDSQVHLDKPELLDSLVHKANLAQEERLDNGVRMDNQVHLETLVPLEVLDLLDLPVHVVKLVLKDHRELADHLELEENLVLMELLAHLERGVSLDLPDQAVNRDNQDLVVKLDHKVDQDPEAKLEHP